MCPEFVKAANGFRCEQVILNVIFPQWPSFTGVGGGFGGLSSSEFPLPVNEWLSSEAEKRQDKLCCRSWPIS
jgi:hypothetical protein